MTPQQFGALCEKTGQPRISTQKSASDKISFKIPMRLISPGNARMHWREVARIKKAQRDNGLFYTLAAEPSKLRVLVCETWKMPALLITITRIGKRKMDDDNLAGSAKYVRDGIADGLGINDGDEKAAIWIYKQEIGTQYGCRVTIEKRK